MLCSKRLFTAILLSAMLLSCSSPGPSGPAGGGSIPSTKVEQGDGLLFRKGRRYASFADTTVILLDSSNNIRVNDVIFQGPEFHRLIVNQWESIYQADTALPLAFRIDLAREASDMQRQSIRQAIARAQDTVRAFVMKREGIDSTAANQKYPVLSQRTGW